MRMFRWFHKLFPKRKPILEGGYSELIRAYRVKDIIVGDLLEVAGEVYLFRGLARCSPGHMVEEKMGYPIPEFGPPAPQKEYNITTFTLSDFPRWKKVGHVTPEEWRVKASLVNVS